MGLTKGRAVLIAEFSVDENLSTQLLTSALLSTIGHAGPVDSWFASTEIANRETQAHGL